MDILVIDLGINQDAMDIDSDSEMAWQKNNILEKELEEEMDSIGNGIDIETDNEDSEEADNENDSDSSDSRDMIDEKAYVGGGTWLNHK